MVIADEKSVETHKLTPLLRIVGWSAVGCDPHIMGIGPVGAIRQLLKRTGVSLESVDLVDVNVFYFIFVYHLYVYFLLYILKIKLPYFLYQSIILSAFFQINEAFAPQIVALQRELKLDNDKLNVNGGAIALGHPLAASGSRISAHLAYELK